MSDNYGSYWFYSYAVPGQALDWTIDDGGVKKLKFTLTVNGDPVNKDFPLIGRDDIRGFSADKILRRVPDSGANVFAPYNLAFVEFYEEDFPWRFSNEKPDNGKLQPWLFLMVFKEGEFTLTKGSDPNLNYLSISDENLTFSLNSLQQELCYWAHVQTVIEDAGKRVKDPDGVISRILCPRKLDPDTAYTAFLIPSYTPPTVPALHLIFHSWKFQTNNEPDFEYLANLLEPREMPPQFGRRQINCEDIGYNVKLPDLATYPTMEGALTSLTPPSSDQATSSQPLLDAQEESRRLIAEVVNEGIEIKSTEDDPVVSPLAYGHKHVLSQEVIDPAKISASSTHSWLHELNTDPGMRSIAGLGAQVIRDHQDNYMERAWAQLESLEIVANRIRKTESAMIATSRVFEKHVVPYANDNRSFDHSEAFLTFARMVRPLLKKIPFPKPDKAISFDGYLATEYENYNGRQVLLTRQGFVKRNKKLNQYFVETGIPKVNNTIFLLITDRYTGQPLQNVDILFNSTLNDYKLSSDTTQPDGSKNITDVDGIISISINDLTLKTYEWYAIAEDYATQPFRIVPTIKTSRSNPLEVSMSGYVETVINSINSQPDDLSTISSYSSKSFNILGRVTDEQTGKAISEVNVDVLVLEAPTGSQIPQEKKTNYDELTRSDGIFSVPFNSRLPGNRAKLRFSKKGYKLKEVIIEWGQVEIEVKMKRSLTESEEAEKLQSTINSIVKETNPVYTQKQKLKKIFNNTPLSSWFDPSSDSQSLPQPLAYPTFDEAMYRKVKELGQDYLVPNLHLMPDNTTTLLKANPKFLEAFFVGLNVEFGRELRWREYPTDERGSYFRQFWEIRGLIPGANNPESYKDIKPIHEWKGRLGSQRPLRSVDDPIPVEPVVFSIRGGLIKAFPNTMIYAIKAVKADITESGLDVKWFDNNGEVTKKIRMSSNSLDLVEPIFSGKLEPDITLKGFPLTKDEAIGTGINEDYGYFFIIKEIAGELRFGLDEKTAQVDFRGWDDLSWLQVELVNSPIISFKKPLINYQNPNNSQFDASDWGRNSATQARIFSQKPVMLAIHASEMI